LHVVHGGNLGVRAWFDQTIDQRLVDPQDGRVRFGSIPVDFWHDSAAEGVRKITFARRRDDRPTFP
jgi:hypothetical protein